MVLENPTIDELIQSLQEFKKDNDFDGHEKVCQHGYPKIEIVLFKLATSGNVGIIINGK